MQSSCGACVIYKQICVSNGILHRLAIVAACSAGVTGTGAMALRYMAVFLLASQGFGFMWALWFARWLFVGCVVSALVQSDRKWSALAIAASFLIVVVNWPAALYLWSVWILLACILEVQSRSFNLRCTTALILWLIVIETALGSWLLLPPYSAGAIPLFLVAGHMLGRSRNAAVLLLGATLLSSLLSWPRPHSATVVEMAPLPFPYQIGAVLNHVLATDATVDRALFADPALTQAGIKEASEIVIVAAEHDQALPHPLGSIAGGSLRQPEPWSQEGLIGNQFVLAAICDDGMLVANIGSRLNNEGQLLLAGIGWERDRLASSLVIQSDSKIVVFDSDMFVNRLAPYQPSLLRVLFGQNSIYWWASIACLAIAACGIGAARMGNVVPYLAAVAFSFAAAGSVVDRVIATGEVRIVAMPSWPHSAGGSSGVLRSMVEAGLTVRSGSCGALVLVVDHGTADWRGEELIVLLPGSRARIGDTVVACGTVPFGEANGITDARELQWTHQTVVGVCLIDGVKVIGTGSPGRVNWRDRLSAASLQRLSGSSPFIFPR